MQHQKSRNLIFFGFFWKSGLFFYFTSNFRPELRTIISTFWYRMQKGQNSMLTCVWLENVHIHIHLFSYFHLYFETFRVFFLKWTFYFYVLDTLTMLTIQRINVSVVPYVHLNLMKAYCEIKHEVKMWESESQAMSHWCTQEKFARLWLNQGSESCRSSMKRWRGNAFCWTRSVWALVQIIKFNSQYCHWQGA